MKTDRNVYRARFIERPNRFVAYVSLNGEILKVHVPNTGRCREILTKDTTVILREENNPQRSTKYDLVCGYKGDKIINIDSQIPNPVVHEALANKKIEKLGKYKIIEREKTYKNSRFDFKLSCNNEIYYLEVKGVTLEENGLAMFPDAPTDRGRKHLLELIEAKREGYGAGVLFLVQTDYVTSFSPNFKMDSKFSEALIECRKNGVDIFAFNSIVTENSITLKDEIEITL